MYGAMSNEADERILPGWLNAARGRGTTSYRRVMNLIELIRQSDEGVLKAAAGGAYHSTSLEAPKIKREKLKLARAALRPYAELQRSLQRYVFHVRLTQYIGGEWMLNFDRPALKEEFGWKTEYGTAPVAAGETRSLPLPTYTVSEGDAVLAVLRLAARGLIGRVRLCVTCSERWLYAKHRNYKFCTAKCRENYYVDTDDYRKRKAGQMKQYRERLRQAEQRGRDYLTSIPRKRRKTTKQ